jgi:hypothetical protein
MRIIYPSLFLPAFADNAEVRVRLLKWTRVIAIMSYVFYLIHILLLDYFVKFVPSYAIFVSLVHQNNFDLPLMILLIYTFRPTKEHFTFTDDLGTPDVSY